MLNWTASNDHERLSRLAAHAVSLFAAGCCVYLLVRIAWLLVPGGGEREAPPASVPTPAAPAAVSVAKWHLFGNPQAIAPAQGAGLATVLKLGLRGTLALPDAKDERAIAIIANEQGLESSYRIGADVVPHARLTEVYADHVVLDHAGVAETLTLPRPEQHAVAAPDKGRGAKAATTAASVPPGTRPAPAPAGSARAGAGAAGLDPSELARQIRPAIAGGRIVGADISGADPALLARYGLQPSDVVTAINGTPLDSMPNPQALIEHLKTSPSIQVTVQRNGKPATLTLNLH